MEDDSELAELAVRWGLEVSKRPRLKPANVADRERPKVYTSGQTRRARRRLSANSDGGPPSPAPSHC
jgi:hypothetical protein